LTDVTFSKNLTDIHVSDVGIQVFPGIWSPVERMRKKLSVATSEISEFSQTQNIYV